MTALFALGSAIVVGGADFLGGVVSRRAPAIGVAFVAQALGAMIGIPVALVWGWESVTTTDVGLSLLSGVLVGTGLAAFYAAMAVGVISLVAPVAAVTGAAIPVVIGLARGERPGPAALVGIAIALVAVAVVSAAPEERSRSRAHRRSLLLALAAGAAFGGFFTVFDSLPEAAGMWPVPLQRLASTALLGVVVLALRVPRSTTIGLLRPGLAIAVLEVTATALVLLALQRGELASTAVLLSLYPVTTVLLAAIVLRERLSPAQLAGVGLALCAVVLIAAG